MPHEGVRVPVSVLSADCSFAVLVDHCQYTSWPICRVL